MALSREMGIKRVICSWLTLKGAFIFTHDSVGIWDPTRKVYRTNKDPYRLKGVADVLGIWAGKFLAIEVKVKGNYPTPEQKEFLANVNRLGGIGMIARSIEDVERELKLRGFL